MLISDAMTVFKIIHTSAIRTFFYLRGVIGKMHMVRLNCWYHVEDHSASFVPQQNFTCSKCAQPMFLFTLNLFHVARNIHMAKRIYVYCTDELESIRARKTITTDQVRLIIHRGLAEVSIDDAGFFMWYNSLFSAPVIKSNYYRTSGYQMKKLRHINTQNREPTCLH